MLLTTFNLISKPASQQHAPIPPNRTLCSSNRTTLQQCIFETSSCFHKELTSSCRLYASKFRSVILLPDSWSPAGHNSYKSKTRGSTANGAYCHIYMQYSRWFPELVTLPWMHPTPSSYYGLSATRWTRLFLPLLSLHALPCQTT